jgi:hydroxyacylglutathione hydrolase
MANFSYVIADKQGGEALAIDSGWEIDPIVGEVNEIKATVKYAVATHNHYDHTQTLRELARALGAKVAAYELSPIDHDVGLRSGERVRLGGASVEVIHTPGHTKDSICLHDGEHLFTGDTLFIGNCGRVDLPGGSAEEMFHSLHDVILKLPPSTIIYPGHDYGDVPFRSLGEEKHRNPTLSVKSYRDFLSVP